jgi:O-acetyl-ADP-ribose deacetylase (regulator of RNase III)
VKPPSALLFTFHAACAGGWNSGVDARIFRHLFHETRQKARVQSRRGNRAAATPPESYSQP